MKRSKVRWPTDVPVLSAQHVAARPEGCKGPLVWWAERTFADASARESFCARLIALVERHWGYHGLPPSWIPASEQAALWNEAMYQCGYDIPSAARVILGQQKYWAARSRRSGRSDSQ